MAFTESLAQASFYPNRGFAQPSKHFWNWFEFFAHPQIFPDCGLDLVGTCTNLWALTVSFRNFFKIFILIFCFIKLFTESITNDQFWAQSCTNFQQIVTGQCVATERTGITMGGEPGNLPGTVGLFSLKTNDYPPFAQNFL